ncbi:glycosyltransferase family 39 protein [Fundidesulfovibrio terrae]|uniref:glycosyltransferase family 39 protein n=1 Tax=Fundidesulfovibrio terrae TaxID=2922866 RepID=UPI001FAF41E9|nr:glycosyltransferase family 39 protein [Fundidesulfovibrio terrae]
MPDVSRGVSARVCLFFLLTAGFALRSYNLGVPSQWMDEILVPLNASHPIEYILELSRRIEVHSPLFYGIIKGLTLVDSGDFLLRLPSALAGATTIYLVYRLGTELFDANVGLYAAVFTALNPHHMYLSRYIRPYSLVVFLFALSLLLTWRVARDGKMRDCLLLLIVDAVVLLLHNLAVLLVGTQLLYLGLSRVAGKSRMGWNGITVLGSGVAVIAACLWCFFLRDSSVAGEFLAQPMGSWDAFLVVGECFLRNLFYFDVPLAWGLGLTACVAGLVMMWRSRPWPALFVSLFLLLPPAALVVTGMAWNLWARHLSPMIPLAALSWAVVVASLRLSPARHAQFVVILCVLGLAAYLGPAHGRFFEVDSYRDRVIGTNYEVLSGEVQALMSTGDVIVVTHDYFRNGLNWYADRLPPPNRFRSQSVDSKADPLKVHVLADLHYGYIAKNRQDFRDHYEPESENSLEENVQMFTLEVKRSPEFVVRQDQRILSVPMDLKGFYSRVGRLRDAVFSQDARGPFVMATRNNTQAEVEYVFVNGTGQAVPEVVLNFYFRNTGKGNHILAETVFDDEPPSEYPLSIGPDPRSNFSVAHHRSGSFKTLTVRLKMVCAPLTPLFPGGNYETLRFEGLDAAFGAPGGDEALARDMAGRLRANSLRNFLAERFIPKSRLEQRMVAGSDLASNADADMPGWSRLEVSLEKEQGVFLAELDPGVQQMIVYPRVGDGSSVGFYQLGPDGRREELLALHGAGEAWTPISAQYPIMLNPGLTIGGKYRVEILLQGRWAQVWNKNGTIFFEK